MAILRPACWLLALACVSCWYHVSAEYTEVAVMPAYKKVRLAGRSMAVYLPRQAITIQNTRDVPVSFGEGPPVERYWAFFQRQFPQYVMARSTLSSVSVHPALPGVPLRERLLPLPSDALIKMNLPPDTSRITIDGERPDYVLFLDEVRVFRRGGRINPPPITPEVPDEPDDVPGARLPRTTREPRKEQEPEYDVGLVEVGFPKMVLQSVFVLWDNTQGQVVSYGDISVGEGGGDENPWTANLEALAGQIIKRSPFRKART
jgi:hypothetical protein